MVEKSAMTKESIFEMLEGFSKYYDVMAPEDKKELLRAMISSIEIYKGKHADGHLIKTIHFTFPVTYDGESGVLFISSTGGEVETVVLLSKGEVDSKKIRVEFSLEDMDMSEFQDGATYTQIKDYLIYNDPIGYADLVLNGSPETYLKTVTEYKPVD